MGVEVVSHSLILKDTGKMKQHIQKLKEDIEELGFEIVPFTDHHWRINGELDIWPTTKSYSNILTGNRGKYSNITEILAAAFPDKLEVREFIDPKTLRDEFAMAAIPTAVWYLKEGYCGTNELSETSPDDVAKISYQIADALMKHRKE
jgi:hypothetical protein